MMKRVLINPDTDEKSLIRRLTTYGLTPERYGQLLKEQGNHCAICQTSHDAYLVDHDHVTGVVRGLLCHGCNSGLGRFGDSARSLRAAIRYLEKHQQKSPKDLAISPISQAVMRRLYRSSCTIKGRAIPRGAKRLIELGWCEYNHETGCLALSSVGRDRIVKSLAL